MIENAEIEIVARRICVELGVDPESRWAHGYTADFTPAELAEFYGNKGETRCIPDILLYSPKWRSYRNEAARTIAVKRAMDNP